MKSLNDVQVSVCIVTYNQENYIAECLESLVNQKTNFKFEIIVGEDCSTDATRAVVQKYVERYPELIVPLFYEENVGAVENIKQVYKAARGKYIAHLDGDDFALPEKLQIQYDVLEQNKDCSICVHDMIAVDKNSKKMEKAFSSFLNGKYKLLDMYLINPFFIHSSKMFVNKIEDYIDTVNKDVLDTEMHIEQARQGDIYYISSELGGYRQFVGITYERNFISELVRNRIIDIYTKSSENDFSDKEIDLIQRKYAKILLEYAYQCAISIKDKELFKLYVNKSLSVKKISLTQYLFKIATYFPETFFWLFSIRSQYRTKV